MPQPFDWNAVVLGFWNVAILSPDGIRRRLFEIPEPAAIELEMAVDRPGVFRVGHGGLVVVPNPFSLDVMPRVSNAEGLERAAVVCQRALRSLPETPVSAAGVNIRYRFAEIPNALFDQFQVPLDGPLADADYVVNASSVTKTLAHPPGVINLAMRFEGSVGTLEFNFHRESNVPNDLSGWLARAQEFVGVSDRLAAIMGVENVRAEINT